MKVTDWQTIDTAPKDGTQVLFWAAAWEMSWGVTVGYFQANSDNGVWVTAEGDVAENDTGFDPNEEVDFEDADEAWDPDKNTGPTHWMPIPAPPAGAP